MYEERFYRGMMRPQDLTCYEVQYKETDLFCCTRGDLSDYIRGRVLFYRNQLEEYIHAKPVFRESLTPIGHDPLAPGIVREMISASKDLGRAIKRFA